MRHIVSRVFVVCAMYVVQRRAALALFVQKAVERVRQTMETQLHAVHDVPGRVERLPLARSA